MIERVKELDKQAEALRAEIERIEGDVYGADEWTAADEARIEALAAEAWRLDDEARRIEANAALADPAFAAHVAATLESPEPGPEYPGDPMVWSAGREYFAVEVIEAWANFRQAAA